MRVVIIGGGAAGFFTAVNVAEKNPDARVILLEAAQRPLQKVFISGGGRCNLTHACFDPARLIEHYPRGQKELRGLFARFQPADTVRWFESRGLKLKTEEDGRMFPVTDRSQDVIDLLLSEARRLDVRWSTGTRVTGIAHDGGLRILQADHPPLAADRLVLATGYSPPGWQLAQSLGHTVIPPVPSLFPFKIQSPVIQGLQGISVAHVKGRLLGDAFKGIQAEGPVLITHTGLSGPVIYRLSAWGARALAEQGYHARMQLDLLPELPEETLRAQLDQLFHQEEARKKIENTQFSPLPQRLWLSLLSASGAPLQERCETISKKAFNRLVENLKRLELPVSGRSPSKEEFVSCGGVSRKEVDFRTMESRRVPGLHFAGEILDIDGLTGGFNFQACWSEAWAISEALKR